MEMSNTEFFVTAEMWATPNYKNLRVSGQSPGNISESPASLRAKSESPGKISQSPPH